MKILEKMKINLIWINLFSIIYIVNIGGKSKKNLMKNFHFSMADYTHKLDERKLVTIRKFDKLVLWRASINVVSSINSHLLPIFLLILLYI